MVEGDDGIIGTDHDDFADQMKANAFALGLDLKMGIKSSLTEVEFCKQRFIEDSTTGLYYSYRSLHSSLLKFGWDSKNQGTNNSKKSQRACAARLNSFDVEYACFPSMMALSKTIRRKLQHTTLKQYSEHYHKWGNKTIP